MGQELKALRDFLRDYCGYGVIVCGVNDYHGLTVGPQAVRALVGLLDRLERESAGVDGYARDM